MRRLSDAESRALEPGADHYRAFVGPPDQYDLMGATQFMLAITLGLREHHRLLDFGCGSLRAGRLFIPYLLPGNYYGIEPNDWLLDEALARQVGNDMINIKQPRFFNNNDFTIDCCRTTFQFILCQSIFSHAGPDLLATALASFHRHLDPSGLVVMTVIHAGPPGGNMELRDGWTYPDCISYAPSRLQDLFAEAEFHGRPIPWFHPRQTWYVLAKRFDRLPDPSADHVLQGTILNEPTWANASAATPSIA